MDSQAATARWPWCVALGLTRAMRVEKKSFWTPSARYRCSRPTGCRRRWYSCRLLSPSPSGSPEPPSAPDATLGLSPAWISQASGRPSLSVSAGAVTGAASCCTVTALPATVSAGRSRHARVGGGHERHRAGSRSRRRSIDRQPGRIAADRPRARTAGVDGERRQAATATGRGLRGRRHVERAGAAAGVGRIDELQALRGRPAPTPAGPA